MTPLVQTVGLTVQNFVSAAVALAVCIALTRALGRDGTGSWATSSRVDLVRGTVRILLPGAVLGAVVLLAGGVIQNLTAPSTITGLSGVEQVVRGGLVASQEAIKEFGTNGGGYFNANSAHPFENPQPLHQPARGVPAPRRAVRPPGPSASWSATAARAGRCWGSPPSCSPPVSP